ncbi:UDP-N-acetylmuramoyl-L-alanyl-D-glutamate--2,6-diaminopimelate ligase [Bacillus suaedaesalsae]|uniref:UDP-N-acetylmuramoyl-L-alanyl-D-glutamate--2,6-diaminopimelate ligase n=1 Tax=Bacillus suaedaesalsae TaxID=2810349 RepID=A0ABS2DJ82_9BACI|nr:UDP-N-acetylmuramoyl-L-alanyl-D-glutamate--2,6-diaminopimelate ligase [Bacillus suaedaesalsae]MBM6618550.1 UDP-N-acetylmuramoyl-L-alanyl-D-glutamate--2,6-diaminopimelate ligase [Bacillus suaedaesalsae]
MQLDILLKNIITYNNDLIENPHITSIEMDSREVKQGSLFICIKGYTVDGHNYVSQALQNGAVAILAEVPVEASVPVAYVNDTKRAMAILADAFYGQPTHKMQLIGITGTNGKTSTTHMIEKIMNAAGKKTGLIGTIHTKIGEQTFEVKNTTPESLTLQKTFSNMLDHQVETAIMEVSSHALDLGRVHGCDYDIAVFTNLTQDHLDYHGTMKEYQRAKGLLFAQLGNTFNVKKPKFAILNHDDAASDEYKRSTAAHVISYGIKNVSDVMASCIKMTNNGTSFKLSIFKKEYDAQIQLLGLFNVYNMLAAIATCIAAKVPVEVILDTLNEIEGVQGRFELVQAGQEFPVIVDYAHTPDSLENAIKTLKEFAKGAVIVIAGCGGDRDKTKRPIMANIAATLADKAIFTSDNPRSEDPVQILKDMEAGVSGKEYTSIVDRAEAIQYAISVAHQDDIVLIAGKGHETYQIIGNQVFDFDDREVAKRAIKERLTEC